MKLNSTFVKNIYDAYPGSAKHWFDCLPVLIKELESLWNFELIRPIENLSYSFVAFVRLGHLNEDSVNQTAVLKLTPEGGPIHQEVAWLQAFSSGVPKVLQYDQKNNAFLMERLQPGNTLKAMVQEGKDDQATRVICSLIRQLQSHQNNVTTSQFKHLADLQISLPLLKSKCDARFLTKAQGLFRELTTDHTHDVLLHGDLHHDNILSSTAGWKMIDPHGYVGDPVAEVGTMIRNPIDCFPKNDSLKKIVEKRLRILAEELPFDFQKIRAWAFCMTVLSAAWTVEGTGHPLPIELEVAAAIDQLK